MEKQLKNYLHLYYGAHCRYRFKARPNWWDGTIGTICIQRFNAGNYEVKLILRHLRDMTDDEENEWRSISNNSQFPSIKHQAEEIRWMLSKHFDLFELIESGLAIDASKVNCKQ